ncbi:hypothetical protein [Tessaracoccus sp. G1721]
MMAPFFFTLGLANAVCLIVVFAVRRRRLELVERYGWLYLLLAVPAVLGLAIAYLEASPVQYPVFLGIFLGFLALEGLYDWVLKVSFRETMDWRLLVPYVALYVSSSYGFVVMPWKDLSPAAGVVMLVLTVGQFLLNALTHLPQRRQVS